MCRSIRVLPNMMPPAIPDEMREAALRTCHVTNVREDSIIPEHEVSPWMRPHARRANVRIGVSGLCLPPLGRVRP